MAQSHVLVVRIVTAITAAIAVGLIVADKAGSATRPPVLAAYQNTDTVPTIDLGAEGAIVADIQTFLAQTGDYSGPIDGVFGATSAQAVAAFQARHGLAVDGVVGSQTWQKLLAQSLFPPIKLLTQGAACL